MSHAEDLAESADRAADAAMIADEAGALPSFHYRPEYKRAARNAAAMTPAELAFAFLDSDAIRRRAAIREFTRRQIETARAGV